MSKQTLLVLPPEILVQILEYLLDRHIRTSGTILLTQEHSFGFVEYCPETKLHELVKQMNIVMSIHPLFSMIIRRTATTRSSEYQNTDSSLITEYFNDLWWRIFLKKCSTLEKRNVNEMKLLQEQVLKKGMKRCLSLFLKVKRSLMKVKEGKIDLNRSAEFKIVVFGAGGVGKSALVIQFIMGQFIGEYDPTIEDSYRKQIEVDGEMALLDILDTAGPEDYYALRRSYIRCADCFIFVCAVDDPRTVHEFDYLIESSEREKESCDIPCIFAINKIDLVRENLIEDVSNIVTEDMVGNVIKKHKLTNYSIFESSGKRAINSTAIFEEIVRRKRMGDIHCTQLMSEIIEHDVNVFEARNVREKKKCLFM
ncbi:hypothetical protein C9374_001793 [Naegleria lovaniensis]|uniref:Ras family small GTPase n=1 Tax=Naegleria lovaniensis TaxID=51637 RepID=A0AA88KND6_NAELO|nr:uncharacterized protein C9374_001793 [Naegleria lovaniensis]KAG2387461.1 hypothetical protein C9374_001793 [Naegleria lovaniensis]